MIIRVRKMKILVLGCNGMAGHMISVYFQEQGHEVIGFARRKSKYVTTIVGDATEAHRIKEVLNGSTYDVVINCIGILNQFAEKYKARAVYLNSYLPHYIATLLEGSSTRLFHMSTDCVFSGKRGQYTEYDFCDGTTFYDRTKAIGEVVDDKNLTLRQSIVGPDINPDGIGLLNWFMKQEGEIQGYTRAIWTGQTTLQLAKTMEWAAQEDVSGLINAVPAQSISKYDLLKLFNRYIRSDALLIQPVDKMAADKSLICTRNDYNLDIPDYEKMVSELASWMKSHSVMYPHYNLI